jgi:uncharacterized small protein (DUF1192 family)
MEPSASSEAKEVDVGCWHGWHGCGPWYGGPYGRSWYDPGEWFGEEDWPIRRRSRRYRRIDREAAIEDLEARLAELRDEVGRVEAELVSMRGSDEPAAERP